LRYAFHIPDRPRPFPVWDVPAPPPDLRDRRFMIDAAGYLSRARRVVVPVAFWAWLAAAVWCGLALDFGLQIYDEGSLLVGARSVAHGGVPSRDFWTAYPPGIFWLVGLVFRVFGEQIIVNRLLHAVIALGVCVAAYHVMAALVGRGRVALLGFLAVALYVGASRVPAGYPPVLCLLLAFWSIADLLGSPGLPSPQRLRRAGLAAGLCATVRYDLAVYLIAASVGGAGLLLARMPGPAVRPGELLRAAAHYVSGFIGPVLLAYGSLIALAGAGPVYAQLVEFPVSVFPRVRALPLERPFEFLFTAPRGAWRATWFLIELARALPFVGIAVGGLGVWRALARSRQASSPLLLAVSLLTLMFFNQYRVRSDWSHAWPLVVGALVVATALLGWMLASTRREVRIAGVVALSAGVTVLVPAMIYRAWGPLSARYLEPSVAVDSPWAAGIRIAASESTMNALLADLRERAADEPYIFSGTTDHDRVMFNDALIYFLAGRQSPTPYPDLVPGVIDTAPTQREVTSALDARAVKTVVIFHHVSSEPNASSQDKGVDILDQFLSRKFRQVAQYPPYYKVLRRERP
jgi:hypothetical protein